MGSVHITSNRKRPPPRVEFDELLRWKHDHGSARHQDHNEYDDPFPVASNRERPPRLDFDELLQRECNHGFAKYQDPNEYDDPYPVASNRERLPRLEFDELLQRQRDHEFAKYQDHNGYDGHGRTGRAMHFVLGDSYRRGLPLWPADLEDCQGERSHRSWR